MPMGHGSAASLAPRRTTVKARHFGVRGGLVDEDNARRIDVELVFELHAHAPRSPCCGAALRRAPSFLRVILRRLKNRHSEPMATATPRSYNPSRSSANVTSDFAAKAERISSTCASIRCEWRSPPWRLGVTAPSPFSWARQRIALDGLAPNRSAAARHDNPPSISPNDAPTSGQPIKLWPCKPASSPASSMNQNQAD